MKNPIILLSTDSGDVDIYRDASIAARSMEAVDVKGGNFRAFDSKGKELLVKTKESEVCVFLFLRSAQELVVIEDTGSSGLNCSEEVRGLIINHLKACGDEADLSNESIEGLILYFVSKLGFSKY